MSSGLPWLPLALGPITSSPPPDVPTSLHAGTCPVVSRAGPWMGYAAGACPASSRPGTGPASL
eukprot:2280402-Lingulodinium_polyedra.AAC.1